jgi:hypothetical protein
LRQSEEPLEQRLGVCLATHQRERIREPEGAWEEVALAGRQTIDAGMRSIAQHQSVDDELALDGLDGAPHARVGRPAESRPAE